MQLYLERLGHEVKTAQEMTTALKEFPGSNCEVLISDISLPDGDGWQLLERMKGTRPSFAIAISGYGSEDDVRRTRSAGYDRHLVKPFFPADLLGLLQEAEAVVVKIVTAKLPVTESGSDRARRAEADRDL